ncbi:MAG: TIGR02117 family protein, partial [Pseudomonadota bacterium]
ATGAFAAATFLGAVWRTAATEGPAGRTIYLISTPIHAELVVPVVDDVADWRPLIVSGAFAGGKADHQLLADISTHAAIGWGARSFYFNVRRLRDIRLQYVLDGLWDESAVHVSMLSEPQEIDGAVRLDLTEAGYRQLIADLKASFAREDGAVQPLAGESYSWNDGFFEGSDAYSLLMTCNEWVGALLRRAGVSVGRFTPFSQTLLISLARPPQRGE